MHGMRVFAMLLFVSCLLAGCNQPSHSDIRLAVAQAPLNADPRYATDASSERLNRLLYCALVDFDVHSRVTPWLADWYPVTPTRYRFTLRSKCRRFHNGQSLTAYDVAATYQSILALPDSPHRSEFSVIEAIRVLDTEQLEFELKQPDPDFPAKLIIGILPQTLIEQSHDFAHAPVGSGDARWVSGTSPIVLERVRDRQRIQLQEVKDPTVRVLKLIRGEVDLVQGDLPPELVGYLKRPRAPDKPALRVVAEAGANFSYIGVNLRDPVLQQVAVRQAIAHAIDREAIIRYALVDGSRTAESILPPEHWAGNPELLPYGYNPERARQLLKQAGVKLPLILEYKTSTDAQRVRLATILQSQLQHVGIELRIKSLDWGTFFQDIKQGQFQLYGLTWVGIKTPEIYTKAFHRLALPPSGFNRGHLSDAQLDKALDAHDWSSATRRIQALLPYIPLWYEGQFAAFQEGVIDYPLYTDGRWDGLRTVHKLARD